MKHITKICICLLCVMGVLLYSSVSNAASANINVAVPSYVQSVLINSYTNMDEQDNYNYYTYEATFSANMSYNSDAYAYGRIQYYFTVNPSTYTGYSIVGVEYNYDSIATETVVSFGYKSENSSTGNNVFFVITLLDNYDVSDRIPQGDVTVRFTYRSLNAPLNTAPYLNLTATVTVNNTSISSTPQMTAGFGNIIKEAITESLQNSNLDDVYAFLSLWKTTQDGYLADIELSVDDVEQWLSYINAVQVSQDNKLELIRQLLSTFPSYSSQMLNYMQQILNMNASQAAQAASNAAAQATQAQQASNAMAAANDFAKPDIGAMNIDPMDYVSADGFSGVSYILGSILNIPTILSMLLICVTCAFIGYALYGKKG